MSSDPTTRRTKLENRLTLVTEQLPAVRSVSFGIWVKMGSRFEAREHVEGKGVRLAVVEADDRNVAGRFE